MTAGGRVVGTSIADAAVAVARRVLDALRSDGDVGLAAHLDSWSDSTAALGAVRLVGADVFAPRLLLGRPPEVADVEVVAESFRVFPPVAEPVTHEQRVTAWRDWGLLRATDAAWLPPPWADADPVLGSARDWPRWSVRAAQLSPLALPGIGGPVVEAVHRDASALARGAVRAALRRDHATTARLVRWIALVTRSGVRLPLEPVLLLDHVRLHAGAEPRLLLDLAIARRLLEAVPR